MFPGAGLLMALLGVTVDLDEFCNTYKLRHFNGSPLCCFSCGADNSDAGPLRHTDCRPCAPWRATLITHEEFLHLFSGLHILWSTLTGLDLSIGNVIYDLMHNCCLGVLQLFNASVLIHVLQDGVRMHGTVEQRKDSLWVSLLACYNELDTPSGERIPHSKFSAVLNTGCSAEYADMHCKAAHARHLLFALNLLVCKRLDLNEGAFRSTRVCLAKLSRFYRICMFSDNYISEPYQTEAKECLDTFLLHQNLLNAHMRTASRPRLLYGIIIKSHILSHIGDNLKFYNPKQWWCYADEDFVGAIAKMGLKEAKGRFMVTISNAVASRYRLRLFLRYDMRRRKGAGLHVVDVSIELAAD